MLACAISAGAVKFLFDSDNFSNRFVDASAVSAVGTVVFGPAGLFSGIDNAYFNIAADRNRSVGLTDAIDFVNLHIGDPTGIRCLAYQQQYFDRQASYLSTGTADRNWDKSIPEGSQKLVAGSPHNLSDSGLSSVSVSCKTLC